MSGTGELDCRSSREVPEPSTENGQINGRAPPCTRNETWQVLGLRRNYSSRVGSNKDSGEHSVVALTKSSASPYWQIRFEVAGVEIRRSSGTSDRRAAQELEEELRRDLWRQIKLGERRWTWADALKRCELENSHQKSWDRTQRSLKILGEYLSPETLLSEIDYDNLLRIRSLLQLRTSKGHGWKTKRLWKKSTCNHDSTGSEDPAV
jgi:hypothetical protein